MILLLAAAYTVFIAPLQEREVVVYTESTVTRGQLQVGITESSYLEYKSYSIDYDLDLHLEDEEEEEEKESQKYLTVEEIYVSQGQLVTAGTPLLKFSEESVEQVRQSLESALAEKKVAYNDAESEYRLAVLEAENSLEKQESAARYAKEEYQATKQKVSDEIAALQLQIDNNTKNVTTLQENVTEAQEVYQEALEEYEAAKEYYEYVGTDKTGEYSSAYNSYKNKRSAYERAQSTLEEATKELSNNTVQIEEAKEQLAVLRARMKIDILAAEQVYEETILSGENAQYSYDATVEDLAVDLKEALEEKESIEEKQKDFEALVGTDGILYAPADSRIAEVSYEEGDTLERTGSLFTYLLAENMQLTVNVTQEDVVSLAVGDEVSIEFGAYQGEVYKGNIVSIDTTATSQDTPTISYNVVIHVEGTLEKLYGGMSADITFITESREDTLYITRKALIEENDKAYVYVDSGLGTKERREVTLGVRNESSVEILEGLEEDEVIYIVTYEKTMNVK